MRLLAFTFLAIVAAMGIQWGVISLPDSLDHALHGFTSLLIFLLPAIATAGMAYATGIWSWYVVLLSILSPFVSAMLLFFIAANVLHRPMYFW
jgi:hypothetical protein